MGDHVKVIAGRYENDTGLIVRVEDNIVVLFSDLTMHEVLVISDLTLHEVSDLTLHEVHVYNVDG